MSTSRETPVEKNITFSEFTALVQNHYEKIKASTARASMALLLKESGYSPVLIEMDFSKLPMYLYLSLSDDIQFKKMKFIRCKLPRDGAFDQCVFVDCGFLDIGRRCDSTDCIFFVKDESSGQHLSKMGFQQCPSNIIISAAGRNPVIGVVYFEAHGTGYTDKMIDILKKHSFNILIMKENFISHPIADDLTFLGGIVLPGGRDVITDPSNYTEREKLESHLVTEALRYQIPTLGVCRGHQFIGHYFGAEIKHVPDHRENTIHIIRDSSSKLFALTEKKFASQTRKRKRVEIEPEENGFRYQSYCAHSQGLFFKEPPPPEKKLRITSKADDGLPESLEVGDNIISFQHHHERNQETSIGKAAMRMFVMMVIDYHEKKQGTPEKTFKV